MVQVCRRELNGARVGILPSFLDGRRSFQLSYGRLIDSNRFTDSAPLVAFENGE